VTRRPYWRWEGRALNPRGWFKAAIAWRRLSAPALFLMSFIVLIAIGTLGLMVLPGLQNGQKLSFVDSVFTMTSAACITGLSVTDVSVQFTRLGQAWILLFVQLGGIGVLTLSTMLIGALGRRLSLRSEMLAMAPTRHDDRTEVWQIALKVARFTIVVEVIGIVLLFALWLPRFDLDDAAWHATFHAISGYCNAGFSTFSDSLMGFQNSPLTLIVISLLVIVGGFGFLTFEELLRWYRTSRAQRVGVRIRVTGVHRLSSHTWVVVVTTLVLLFGGWILFAIFEWPDALSTMSTGEKLANSWFMSVTARSSGFNSLDYTTIGNDSATLTMMLMFVGGSPGSTAGGIKTSTLAVLVALAVSRMRGLRFVGVKDRAIPERTIESSIAIILLSMVVLLASFFVFSAIESHGASTNATRQQFLPIAFETVSAFSTTGLSMNLTPTLSTGSKLVLIPLMFIGRVGLLSFFAAVTLRRAHPPAFQRPAQEDIIVG
jgi:trk system potassium uptake protein TrkH